MLRDHLWLLPVLAVVVVLLTLIPIVITTWVPVSPSHSAFSSGSGGESGLLQLGIISGFALAVYVGVRKYLLQTMPKTNR